LPSALPSTPIDMRAAFFSDLFRLIWNLIH
jgi:hypothetical protein